MKKILIAIVAVFALVFPLFACKSGPVEGLVKVYMPNGAPALAMAKLMHDNNQFLTNDVTNRTVEYNVVATGDISIPVIQKEAGLALLPINTASLIAVDGKNYKMISVNTHGNLYIIGTGTATTLDGLKGEKVGVVNLANVPGITFRVILEKAGISYVTDGSIPKANEISLVAIDGTEVAQRLKSDLKYVLAPEPAVTTVTTKAVLEANILMDIQTLYGGDYPQAVLLARIDVYKDTQFINAVLAALEENISWLDGNIANAVSAINANLVPGVTESITAANLNGAVIANCNIKVVLAKDAKAQVNDYIAKIRALNISPAPALELKNAFFG